MHLLQTCHLVLDTQQNGDQFGEKRKEVNTSKAQGLQAKSGVYDFWFIGSKYDPASTHVEYDQNVLKCLFYTAVK